MGRVFLARDPNLDRNIALKVMAPLQLADPDERAVLERRFLNEARAAARLHHPGIVMVLDADTDAATGSSYLAMELVEGRSLKDLLRESGRLPAATVSDLGSQVARALDHAHRASVVHRDVKPANILVSPEGRVKVTDFGIAKVASQSMTLTGQILGSPFFMSPEQVKGVPVDGRSDLFSLGSILYQCATGELPFGGDSLAAVTYGVTQVDPPPPRSHVPDLPSTLEAVIERALQKDPARRFQTGADMAEALEAVAREPGLAAGSVRDSEPDTEADRHPDVSGGSTGSDAGKPVARAGIPRLPRMVGGVALSLLLFGLFVHRAGNPPDPPAGPGVEVGDPGLQDPTRPAAGDGANAIEIPETIEPPLVSSATLRITYLHRLTRARLSVSVDGQAVWSRDVDRPGGILKRVSGRRVEGSIPVPPGPHAIEVRVTAQPRDIDLREVVQGTFREGEVRRLRVGLNPVTKNLKLSWTD